MKMKFTLLLLLASVGVGTAQADQWCYGQIKSIYMTDSGNVLVVTTFNPSWLQICHLQTTWNGVTPEICKSWYALALTLRVTGETAGLHYSGSTACNALPNYGAAPAPTAFMIAAPT